MSKDNESRETVFKFSKTGVKAVGADPSFDDWLKSIKEITMVTASHQWWIGDLMNFGEAKFADQCIQAINDLGLDFDTLKNYKWVSKAIAPPQRRDDVSWQHHVSVAKLDPDKQEQWLKRASEKKWSAAALKSAIKTKLQRDESKRQDDDESEGASGRYRVILAQIDKDVEMDTLEQVKVPAEQNSVIFVVVPSDRVRDGIVILEAWNFAYAASAVIDHGKADGKDWFRNQHSVIVVGTRGNIQSPPPERLAPSVLRAKPAKGGGIPDEVFDCISDMFPSPRVKRLDLFGTEQRDGWDIRVEETAEAE